MWGGAGHMGVYEPRLEKELGSSRDWAEPGRAEPGRARAGPGRANLWRAGNVFSHILHFDLFAIPHVRTNVIGGPSCI